MLPEQVRKARRAHRPSPRVEEQVAVFERGPDIEPLVEAGPRLPEPRFQIAVRRVPAGRMQHDQSRLAELRPADDEAIGSRVVRLAGRLDMSRPLELADESHEFGGSGTLAPAPESERCAKRAVMKIVPQKTADDSPSTVLRSIAASSSQVRKRRAMRPVSG